MSFELVSDLHKDARGFRPSAQWMEWFNSLPYSEKEATYVGLIKDVEASIEEEKQQEQKAYDEFKAYIRKLCEDHNIGWLTAIRWDMQAEGVDLSFEQDLDYYFFEKGLGMDRSNELIRKIMGKD